MNVIRSIFVFVHRTFLELLLGLAVALLVAQLAWPSVIRWWYSPSPGALGWDYFESRTLANDFAVRLPQSYHNGQLWPLIIFLHGGTRPGFDPRNLRTRGPLALDMPAIIAAPYCRPSNSWDPDGVAEFAEHVASKYRVDRTRIYLIGNSMGGYGTWHTAAAHPDLFAAVVPICGGGDPNSAARLIKLPIWAFHGAKDDVVPVEQSSRMVEAIRGAGGQPRLTILTGAGHGICDEVCRGADLWEWLFSQKRVGAIARSRFRSYQTSGL